MNMSPIKPTPKYWEASLLETNNGSHPALLFDHPAHEEGFPDIYLLFKPHPLWHQVFFQAIIPSVISLHSTTYVVTVQKDLKFMESWHNTGAKTRTPSDDISLNLKNGVQPTTPTHWI